MKSKIRLTNMYLILSYLNNGEAHISKIAKNIGMTNSWLGSAIYELRKMGLVEIEKRDRRTIASLSNNGREVLKKLSELKLLLSSESG